MLTCPPSTPRESIISAVVTDDTGVASVTASWSDPGGSQSVPMGNVGNVYTMTFGPYAAGDWDALSNAPHKHNVIVSITAWDAAGNKEAKTVNVTVWEIGDCVI
jgi:hypothetical protein